MGFFGLLLVEKQCYFNRDYLLIVHNQRERKRLHWKKYLQNNDSTHMWWYDMPRYTWWRYRLLSLLPRMSCFIIDFVLELVIEHDLTVLMLVKKVCWWKTNSDETLTNFWNVGMIKFLNFKFWYWYFIRLDEIFKILKILFRYHTLEIAP